MRLALTQHNGATENSLWLTLTPCKVSCYFEGRWHDTFCRLTIPDPTLSFSWETLRYHPVVTFLSREAGRKDIIPITPQITRTRQEITSTPVSKGQRVLIAVGAYKRRLPHLTYPVSCCNTGLDCHLCRARMPMCGDMSVS
jgi:hypothetical protein